MRANDQSFDIRALLYVAEYFFDKYFTRFDNVPRHLLPTAWNASKREEIIDEDWRSCSFLYPVSVIDIDPKIYPKIIIS